MPLTAPPSRTKCSNTWLMPIGNVSHLYHHTVYTDIYSHIRVYTEHVHFSYWMSNNKFYGGFWKHQVNGAIFICAYKLSGNWELIDALGIPIEP